HVNAASRLGRRLCRYLVKPPKLFRRQRSIVALVQGIEKLSYPGKLVARYLSVVVRVQVLDQDLGVSAEPAAWPAAPSRPAPGPLVLINKSAVALIQPLKELRRTLT